MTLLIKHTKEKLEEAVSKSCSFAGVLRYLNLNYSSGLQSYIKTRIVFYNIDYSHFSRRVTLTGNCQQLIAKDILIVSDKYFRAKSYQLKRALIEIGRECICEQCGIGEIYNNKPLTLQIDHIDGNWYNNLEHNLRFLCPNCHSQTSTYGNKKTIKEKETTIHLRKFEISKEDLLELVWKIPTSQIAKQFNVSDKAIEKRCKLLGINKPSRGYWRKTRTCENVKHENLIMEV
jgi:Zn finger protein HypA/HybF involved in hydrogenase expression